MAGQENPNTSPTKESPRRPAGEKLPPKPPKTPEQLAWAAARREHFNAHVWQPLLRPIVALLSICLVTSLLLGLTNALTAPIITQNAAIEAEQARRQLLPAADTFEAVSPPRNTAMSPGGGSIIAIYKAANGVGWIVEAYGRGYGGRVPATVAFGPDGGIVGVVFPLNGETVGLGQKVTEPAFAAQFAGRAAQPLTLSDIDAVASATISSRAAVSAINAAIDTYNSLTGQDAEFFEKEAP